MNLVTDIGNTSVKTALFDGGELVSVERCEAGDAMVKIASLLAFNTIEAAIISSVASDPAELISLLSEKGCFVHHLTRSSRFPFSSDYKTPGTLGVDRLAAAAGAVSIFGSGNMLIIDAGSAVTFDVVSDKVFRGGTISPGMDMRFRALHAFTGRLPLCTFTKPITFPATGTVEAITTGVVRGLVFELNEYIRTFTAGHDNPVVILTGGDSQALGEMITGEFILLPNLVLEGLNHLLDYNR